MSAVFRLCASSYTHALLTIGTRVTPQLGRNIRDDHADLVGVIEDIRENQDSGDVLVCWPTGEREWRAGRSLARVGKAVRGPR